MKKLLIIMVSMLITIGSISAKESYVEIRDFPVVLAVGPKTGIEHSYASLNSMFRDYRGTGCDIPEYKCIKCIPEDEWYSIIDFGIFFRIDF